MDKIIVPVDFSEYSEYALEAAASLARNNQAEILALHMLELSEDSLTSSDNEQQAQAVFFLKMAEKKFNEFLERDYLKDVKVIPIVKHFKVFSEVSDVAENHSADLIVMGSHGTSGISEFFVGSNTERVVRHSKVPVLVIKNKPENLQFNHVVFACNFSDEVSEAYKKVKSMFKNSKLSVLYVNTPTDSFKSTTQIENRVNEFLQKADGNLDSLNLVNYVSDYSVEDGVLSFANKVNADLIITPTHGRTGIAHFFEGSISEDIANHAGIPVMTFKI